MALSSMYHNITDDVKNTIQMMINHSNNVVFQSFPASWHPFAMMNAADTGFQFYGIVWWN
jgi:hypothetical protein